MPMRAPIIFKRLVFFLSLLLALFCTLQILHSLAVLKNTIFPEVYLNRIALSLVALFLTILGGWINFRLLGGIIFAVFGFVMVLLASAIAKTTAFVGLLVEYGILCFLLFRLDEYYENLVAGLTVDREKMQNQKNDLEVTYKTKGEGISILFEKYSTYYHLRKFAEELTVYLSLSELPKLIVEKSLEFIPRGDVASVVLTEADEKTLTLAASKAVKGDDKSILQQGDLFDYWVKSNRKRLIVSDTHQDFRFDLRKTVQQKSLRSLIIVPLIVEGKVIGTLRLNAEKPETFINDDLRLLDAIATLASSAIANAKLYEQTTELAIRDSLTGVFVRRYFFERLREEHGRSLLMNRPMSLLMCDLDFFKDCNDRYGHHAGDLMLIQFVETLKQQVDNGLIARYGGEEFVVLLTETKKEQAAQLAEKIRKAVDNTLFELRREKIKMNVSIGVASLPEDTLDMEMLVQKADQALYRAKREGRNKVCLSEG